MFRSISRAVLVVLACGVALAAMRTTLHADHHEKPGASKSAEAKKAPSESDDMMAEMMKYAMPAAAHAKLEPMVGTWKAVNRSWMAPGQEPLVTEATTENRMILGGRYLETRYHGSFMDQPFEGYGLTGYDVRTGKYQSYWVDNMSTNMMLGEGTMDDAGKVLTITMEGPGPSPDIKTATYRAETEIVDENRHVYRMHMAAGGQEALIMEITYTRQ